VFSVTETDGILRVSRAGPGTERGGRDSNLIDAMGVVAGALCLLGMVAAAGGAPILAAFLFIAAPFAFLIQSGIGLRNAWVEIDAARGVVREHRPAVWPEPRERPFSAFSAVDIRSDYEGPEAFWFLVLVCSGALLPLELGGSADAAEIRAVARRVAEATGLPLGEEARRMLQAASS
jgi:hypothetical protein